jgi:hypothetical protein
MVAEESLEPPTRGLYQKRTFRLRPTCGHSRQKTRFSKADLGGNLSLCLLRAQLLSFRAAYIITNSGQVFGSALNDRYGLDKDNTALLRAGSRNHLAVEVHPFLTKGARIS